MSTTPEQLAPSPGAPRFIQALVLYRKQVSYALFVVAALLLVIPLWPLIQVKFQLMHLDRWPVVLWGLALTLTALTAAIVNLVVEPSPDLGETGQLRVLLLALGGAAGLATALLGFILPWTVYSEVYSGGFAKWRQSPWALIWPGVALVGGLVLMFVSLQLARGMERTHGVLRRLLYGFNAVLASLLLLLALALLNVLPYSNVPPFDALNRTFNWTASGFYELAPDNKEFLRSLSKPVKVYVLLPQGYLVTQDVESLLENCRGVTPDITWQTVSRDRDRAEMQRLRAEYAIPDALGLLVVYGGDKGESQFIKASDLTKEDAGLGDSSGQYVFTGETALMKAVQSLVENKKRPVIYFTQGSGELDFNFSRATRGEDVSALRDRLREGDYDTKELRLDVNTRSIPGDATVVVIARPTDKLPDNAIKALRDYARGKKGKLMVLLDVVTKRSGGMVTTGLEPLLREFNVKANDDRVLTLDSNLPATFAIARVNPDLDNPISRAFNPGGGQPIGLIFDDARTVEPLQAGPGGKYLAQELLYAVPDFGPWRETDLEANPSALRDKLRDPDNLKLRQEKITDKRLSLAVTVAESKGGGMPRDQFHQNVNKDDEPLMVVFGDADWVSMRWVRGAQGAINYDLFTRCVSWLRNRPPIDVPSTEGKARKEYVLKVSDPATVSRMEWLPLGLMFLGVVGLGCGIWVVRRR